MASCFSPYPTHWPFWFKEMPMGAFTSWIVLIPFLCLYSLQNTSISGCLMKSGATNSKCSENCCVSSSPQSDILDNQSGSLMSLILLFAIPSMWTLLTLTKHNREWLWRMTHEAQGKKPQQAPFSIPEALTHQLNNIYITLQYAPQASNLLPLFALDQTINQATFFSSSIRKSKRCSRLLQL